MYFRFFFTSDIGDFRYGRNDNKHVLTIRFPPMISCIMLESSWVVWVRGIPININFSAHVFCVPDQNNVCGVVINAYDNCILIDLDISTKCIQINFWSLIFVLYPLESKPLPGSDFWSFAFCVLLWNENIYVYVIILVCVIKTCNQR